MESKVSVRVKLRYRDFENLKRKNQQANCRQQTWTVFECMIFMNFDI